MKSYTSTAGWTESPRFARAGRTFHPTPAGWPIRSYDISLDGQRFLMVKEEQREPTPVTELVLVQNWFEELKQKVPVMVQEKVRTFRTEGRRNARGETYPWIGIQGHYDDSTTVCVRRPP